MKKIVLVILSLVTLAAYGQETNPDTTYSNGVNDVFYSFRGGVLKTVPSDNWDIAFEITGVTSSVIINDGAGVELYKTPFTEAEWSSFDTAGMSAWSRQHNSMESWSEGAFNRGLFDDFDLGWGKYDVNTHMVRGDSIFLIKLRNGEWKKIMILNLSAGKYNFKYADVDGANEKIKALAKSDFSGKTFGYYSVVDGMSLDREPSGEIWDMIFTKYLMPVDMGGTIVYYPVYGVKTNKGVEVARRENVDVMSNDTMSALWDYNITNIGSDWKTFDNQSQTYTITGDLSFFVKTFLGDVWKIYFTEYVGGNEGMSVFNVTNIRSTVSVKEAMIATVAVYPNPASSFIAVHATTDLSDVTVSIMDLQGRIVLKENTGDKMNIRVNISGVPAGAYLVQIDSKEGSLTQRLIIQ